ncbi:hypothetical protein QWY75_09545 [Pontixanthobacter aestiaquae]|uniref:Peptidase inhibitor I78 family protein n=1 Tax=Pontixanthobacter aestiaquae TaxID=1509367 RepID=A0A844Z6X8_9SPHN|nr:hypothetical protein [Pontixanthobacter aestiaquae]MDN3646441.1 hypothetical protein [Pontixanthobacter aestiaquae]MXO82570.1 hypothetical protein [Pontixanthobacter aestiaquae]
MNTKLVAASAASALIGTLLTACGSGETVAPDSEAKQNPQTGDAVTGSATNEVRGGPAALETSPVGDPNAPDVAGENCIKQLASTANQPASMISIQRVEVDETGPTHFLTIKGGDAPWLCKTMPDGTVTEVMYTQEG